MPVLHTSRLYYTPHDCLTHLKQLHMSGTPILSSGPTAILMPRMTIPPVYYTFNARITNYAPQELIRCFRWTFGHHICGSVHQPRASIHQPLAQPRAICYSIHQPHSIHQPLASYLLFYSSTAYLLFFSSTHEHAPRPTAARERDPDPLDRGCPLRRLHDPGLDPP